MSGFQLRCPCGEVLVADEREAMIAEARTHLADEHPDLISTYSDDDILAVSMVIPVWKEK